MKKIYKKVYNITVNTLIAITVLLAILLVGVRLFGLTPYTVLSGSMEPTYHVGSLIYVKSVGAEELQPDDPVTYRLSGTAVTHRIIEVVEDPLHGKAFRTQGDANNVADGQLVTSEKILGKPIFSIPYLGYVSQFVQHPPGLYLAVGGFAVLILLSFIADLIFDDKVPSSKKEE